MFEQGLGDFAFTDLWVRQAPHHGHSVGGADQVETQAPAKPIPCTRATPKPLHPGKISPLGRA